MLLCDAAIAVSGTITLELALNQVPMVIVYKTDWLMYHLAKRLARVQHIGLCNIVANQSIAPELIQHEANADNIAHHIIDLLDNPEKIARQKQLYRTLTQTMTQPEQAPNVADIAHQLLV